MLDNKFDWVAFSKKHPEKTFVLDPQNKINQLKLFEETTWYMPFWMARQFVRHRSLKIQSLEVLPGIVYFDDLTTSFMNSFYDIQPKREAIMSSRTMVTFIPSQKAIETLLLQRLDANAQAEWRYFLDDKEEKFVVNFGANESVKIEPNFNFSFQDYKRDYLPNQVYEFSDISIAELTSLTMRDDLSFNELSGRYASVDKFKVDDEYVEAYKSAMEHFYANTSGKSKNEAREFARQFLPIDTKTKAIVSDQNFFSQSADDIVLLKKGNGIVDLVFSTETKVVRNGYRYDVDPYVTEELHCNIGLEKMPEFVCRCARVSFGNQDEIMEKEYIKQLYTKLFNNKHFGCWEHIKLCSNYSDPTTHIKFNMRDVIESLTDAEREIFLKESLSFV